MKSNEQSQIIVDASFTDAQELRIRELMRLEIERAALDAWGNHLTPSSNDRLELSEEAI